MSLSILEAHSTFSWHISLVFSSLLQFLGLSLYFVGLTVLKTPRQAFHRLSLSVGLSDVSSGLA
jgi:hypothetical protein